MKLKASTSKHIVLFAVVSLLLLGCTLDGDTFTLYRNSALDSNMRIHVATFDAADGVNYNSENCDVAAGLFNKQQGVTTRYWCEKGKYRK